MQGSDGRPGGITEYLGRLLATAGSDRKARLWQVPADADRRQEQHSHRIVIASMGGHYRRARARRAHVTMTFTGGSPEWTEYPSAEVLESGGSLAIVPAEVDTGPGGWRTTMGYPREVTVILARPLSGRVLLDQSGAPVMVSAPAVRHG